MFFEITIAADVLSYPLTVIAKALLHEMAHLYNLQYGIKDSSRANMYHSKRFKETAEKHGLSVEYTKRNGWSDISLNDEARNFIEQMNQKPFPLYRKMERTKPDKNDDSNFDDFGRPFVKKSTYYRYVCPKCKLIVRTTRRASIACLCQGETGDKNRSGIRMVENYEKKITPSFWKKYIGPPSEFSEWYEDNQNS